MQNWSRLKRWYITILSSALVFNATLASSAPIGIVPTLAAQYHMSHTLGVLTISLFVAGFAVGPLLWAPLSEQVSPIWNIPLVSQSDVPW